MMVHYFDRVSMCNISLSDFDYGALRARLFKKSKIYLLYYIPMEKLALESYGYRLYFKAKYISRFIKIGFTFTVSSPRALHLVVFETRTCKLAESKVCDG